MGDAFSNTNYDLGLDPSLCLESYLGLGQTLQLDPNFGVDGDMTGQTVTVEHSDLKVEVKQEADQVVNCHFEVPVMQSELTSLLQQDVKPLVSQVTSIADVKPSVGQVTNIAMVQPHSLNGEQTAALKTLLQLNQEAQAKKLQEVMLSLLHV